MRILLGICLATVLPGAGRAEKARVPPLPRDASLTCLECHARPAGLSHPVGIQPPSDRDVHLPLEPGGAISCLSCHDDRARDPSHAISAEGLPLLRDTPQRLCLDCHDEPTESSSHGLFLGRAHMHFEGEADGGGEVQDGMDSLSRTCLACHDGTTAPSAGVRDAEGLSRPIAGSMGVEAEHPIGIPYDVSWGRPGTRSLHSASSLPPEVQLVDGKVGCLSCHAPYSTLDDRLVLDNRHGRLCLSCHVK